MIALQGKKFAKWREYNIITQALWDTLNDQLRQYEEGWFKVSAWATLRTMNVIETYRLALLYLKKACEQTETMKFEEELKSHDWQTMTKRYKKFLTGNPYLMGD